MQVRATAIDMLGESEDIREIRGAVRRLCEKYPGEYWRGLDREDAYPVEFVKELTEAGYLSVLIATEN